MKFAKKKNNIANEKLIRYKNIKCDILLKTSGFRYLKMSLWKWVERVFETYHEKIIISLIKSEMVIRIIFC